MAQTVEFAALAPQPAATVPEALTRAAGGGATLQRAPLRQRRQTLLALQRTAGNATVRRLVASGAATIQRAPALTTDDYTTLAANLHSAMAGWGTDEEAIFVSLQKLEKDATAIAALKKAYQDTYKEDLESEIRSELSGSELDLALELLGAGGTGKAPMVGGAPAGAADVEAAAQRLHTAMEGWGTDEEAVYAALLPFNRDATKLTTLKTAYKTKYGTELEDDIKSEMSSDELAYALYLLNAPPSGTPHADVAVTSPGIEDHAGTVPGGNVSVHTGVEYTNRGAPRTGGFSVGYEGGLAADSGWIQFIWAEVHATQADGSVLTVAEGGLGTSNGDMETSTDPTSPNYKVDSGSADSPFYEAGFVDIRTATGTTIYDRPHEFSDLIKRQFDAGATRVIERDHFDQFLVQDYKTIYHTSLYVEWDYTARATVNRTTKAEGGGKVDGMPAAFKKQLVKEYPKFDYVQ
jgi:hypothetical protein